MQTSGGVGGGLFGATASAAPSLGGSLFGGGASTAKPPAGNLVGGGAAAASTAAPAGGGLFGGAPSRTQSSTQGAGSSLFGNNSGNASLFQSGLLPKQTEQRQDIAAYGPTAPPPQPAYFDALLQRGKKRQTEDGVSAFGELPHLQLGLQDISRKVRNLGQGGPSAGVARGGDARAHYLLSASGVNTGKALRDLEDLAGSTNPSAQAATEASDLLIGNGVKDTLAQKYQNDFQNMVSAHVQKSKDDFYKMIDEKLHGVDWDSHRQRIYEHFGLKKPQNLDDSTADGAYESVSGSFGRSSRRGRQGASTLNKSYGLPGMARSVIGTPGPMAARRSVFGDVADKLPADGVRTASDDRVLRIKQEHYADRVKDLNVARLQEKVYPILKKFSEVEAEPSNDDYSMLVNAYKALVHITGENPEIENMADPSAIRERAYAGAYVDDNTHSQASARMRKRILDGSRRFLEELHYSQVEATVARNPREAEVGGVPTPLAKIKGFVRLKAIRKELGPDMDPLTLMGDSYCWAVVFFMLRSGLYQEAIQYVNEEKGFRQLDRPFVNYLSAYVGSEERRLPGELQTKLNNEFSARSRLAPENSTDPFRTACHKIIGRCDIHKRTLDGFKTEMNDWLWLQFALAREYTRVDEFAHEAFGLDELRASISEIGERYFGPSSEIADAPSTLFFMQVLAGMFEKAVTDLYPLNYISANHFAIALDYYGLLRVSDIANSEDLLTYTTRQQPQLSFGSMIGLYTRDFRTASPTTAIDYLCLICLNGDLQGELGRKQRELCHQALTEVVLETREFAQLLGDIRADGQRIKGAIEQRLKLIGLDDERDFLKHITLVAARTAEEQSRVTDAALCFHLAEDYDKVIQVVNEAVSLSLTTELGEQAAKLTPLKPRAMEGTAAAQQQQPPQMTSLSLTAVDDPLDLAMNMRQLYASSQMYYDKIKDVNRDSCEVLLKLADARRALEQGNWALAVDVSISTTPPSLPALLSPRSNRVLILLYSA